MRLYNCEKEIKENGIALKIKMDIDYWKRKIVGLFLSLSVCLRWWPENDVFWSFFRKSKGD